MGDKEVTELAGIGDVLGGKLVEAGFDKAYLVLGKFLGLRKNEQLFLHWIKTTTGANEAQAALCYNCLKKWCEAHL
jgi:hypothetical protein